MRSFADNITTKRTSGDGHSCIGLQGPCNSSVSGRGVRGRLSRECYGKPERAGSWMEKVESCNLERIGLPGLRTECRMCCKIMSRPNLFQDWRRGRIFRAAAFEVDIGGYDTKAGNFGSTVNFHPQIPELCNLSMLTCCIE